MICVTFPTDRLPNRQRLLQLLEQHVEWAVPRQRGIAVQGFLFCRPLAIADLHRWHTDWLHSNELRGDVA